MKLLAVITIELASPRQKVILTRESGMLEIIHFYHNAVWQLTSHAVVLGFKPYILNFYSTEYNRVL